MTVYRKIRRKYICERDKIFDLLKKYDYHLDRGEWPIDRFLKKNFAQYIDDLKQAVRSEDNPVLGAKVCALIEQNILSIRKNADSLIKVLDLSIYKNDKDGARCLAFQIFEAMRPHFLQHRCKSERYYRIRKLSDESITHLERKEMFHVPYDKKENVSASRYSLAEVPCLYLATQPELAWCECDQPFRFAIAQFDLPSPEEGCLHLIDFSPKMVMRSTGFASCFRSSPEKEDPERKKSIQALCIYPLRAACSVTKARQEDCVKTAKGGQDEKSTQEEYILPQLLMEWIRDGQEFDGICYESSSSSCKEILRCLGGYNIALPTRECNMDEEGYDRQLRAKIKVGEPTIFNPDNFSIDFRHI